MTHPIIKTENYLLVVDESNYYDEYYLNKIDMQIYKRDGGGNIPTEGGVWHKKITFHLPLKNAPTLEGVPLLPPLEDDFVELAKKYGISIGDKAGTSAFDFMRGYDKAKEKYKYTEEDMRKAIEMAKVMGYGDSATYPMPDVYDEEEIIQSLQQSKYPVAFESTIGVCSKWLAEQCDNNCCGKPEKIITITNSQGIIQVVGNYIYDQITSH
jgi:hypothetical protein